MFGNYCQLLGYRYECVHHKSHQYSQFYLNILGCFLCVSMYLLYQLELESLLRLRFLKVNRRILFPNLSVMLFRGFLYIYHVNLDYDKKNVFEGKEGHTKFLR